MHRSLSPGARPASAAHELFRMATFTGADAVAPVAVLLTDNRGAVGHQPNLFERIDAHDRCLLLARARRDVVYRGKHIMSQGDAHHGICLIESGVVRSYYA